MLLLLARICVTLSRQDVYNVTQNVTEFT